MDLAKALGIGYTSHLSPSKLKDTRWFAKKLFHIQSSTPQISTTKKKEKILASQGISHAMARCPQEQERGRERERPNSYLGRRPGCGSRPHANLGKVAQLGPLCSLHMPELLP